MTNINKILTYKNFLPLYLVIVFLFDILLINLPLTKVFGYEYSVLNSVLLLFLSGIFSIKLLKKYPENKKEVVNTLSIFYTLLILLPPAVSIINSFFTIKCSLWDGFLFFLVITGPSIIIGYSLGFFSFILFKRFEILIFILSYLILLFIPFCEFYFNPQVYFYNPVLGFLPGTIYDEGLSVDLKLAVYRFLNLLFFGMILILSYRIKFDQNTISKKFLFILVLLIPALFIYFSPDFRYSTDKNRIEKELSKTIVTPHFIIHYPADINTNLIIDIALHHEYYYEELKDFFKVSLNKKIESFLFLNSEQKKNLFGSANADVAKPWLMQIYLSYENYNESLKHEIAHCFTSAFATGIFKIAAGFNPYLLEGAAVAADPIYDENNIHFMAALAYNSGYKINVKNLFNYFSFFEQTSSISYIFAGSFSDFLINKYGIEKYKELYSDLNFEKIYSTSIEKLNKYYINFIDSINTKGNVHKAIYYFGRKSIFYKVCPRYISDRLKDAWEQYNRKNYTNAKKIFKDIFDLGKNYSALIGMANCESKLNNNEKAIDLLNKNISVFQNTSYYYGVELQLGDFLSEQDYYHKADSIYNELITQNPSRNFYYISNLRRALIKDSLINFYLKGNEFDKFQIIRNINETNYNYNSIPVFIDLSKSLEEQYELFLKYFNKTIRVSNYPESYAIYRLSIYMLENLDFPRARKMAALSLRYNSDKNFNYILQDNYLKTVWFYNHGEQTLKQFEYK